MVDLKTLRAKAGMSQQELADECHVVRQTICEIERGANRPSIETAKALAKVLHVKWTDFYEEE